MVDNWEGLFCEWGWVGLGVGNVFRLGFCFIYIGNLYVFGGVIIWFFGCVD